MGSLKDEIKNCEGISEPKYNFEEDQYRLRDMTNSNFKKPSGLIPEHAAGDMQCQPETRAAVRSCMPQHEHRIKDKMYCERLPRHADPFRFICIAVHLLDAADPEAPLAEDLPGADRRRRDPAIVHPVAC